MQRKAGIRWAIFLAAVLGGFAVLEGPALADPASGDTLSEFVRMLIEHGGELGIAAFVSLLVWFGVHILRKVR